MKEQMAGRAAAKEDHVGCTSTRLWASRLVRISVDQKDPGVGVIFRLYAWDWSVVLVWQAEAMCANRLTDQVCDVVSIGPLVGVSTAISLASCTRHRFGLNESRNARER